MEITRFEAGGLAQRIAIGNFQKTASEFDKAQVAKPPQHPICVDGGIADMLIAGVGG